MMYAKKGNRIRQVAQHEVEKYLSLGYDIVDANCNMIQATIPVDLVTLQKCYAEHIHTIEVLERENASLKAQIENLTKQTSTVKTEESVKKTKKTAKDAE